MERLFNILSSYSFTTLEVGINSIVIGFLLVVLFTFCKRFMRYGLSNLRYTTLWVILLAVLIIPMFTVSYGNDYFKSTAQKSNYQPAKKIDNFNPPTTQAVGVKTPDLKKTKNRVPAQTAGLEINPKTFSAEENSSSANASMNLMKLLPLLIFIGYLIAAVMLLVKLKQSYFSIRQIKKSAKLLIGVKPFEKAAAELGLKRKIRFGVSPDISIPIAAGFFSPMILLPVNLMEELSEDELRVVLLHELAHLKRWDDFSKLGQKIIESIWFFHPLVKWLGRQIDLEREIAVDDIVIKKTGSADRYAECLTRLMQLTTVTGTSLIPAVYADKKQIFKRFEEILMKKRRDKRKLSTVKTAGIMTAAAVLVVAVLQITPVIALPGTHMTYQEMLDHLEQTISNTEQSKELTSSTTSTITPVASVVWDKNNESESPQDKTINTSEFKAFTNTTAKSKNDNCDVSDTDCTGYTVIDFEPVLDFDLDPVIDFDSDLDFDPEFEFEFDTDIDPIPENFYGLRDKDGFLQRIVDWSNEFTSNFGTGTSITSNDDGVVSVYISERRYKLKAKFAGDIEFTENDRAINSISDDGFVAIYEKDGSDERELDIVADKNGALDVIYLINDDEHIFDDDGKEWLAGVLEILYHRTGLNYEKRVDRLFTENGVNGVLDEIEKIKSGYVTRLYMTALLNHTDLSDDEYSKVINIAGNKIDSDYEKAELLIGISESIQHNSDLVEVYVRAVATIDSDYETRRVLSELTLDKNTNKDIIAAVLEISKDIDSDYERAELLIDIADICADDQMLSGSYIKALADIDSDYEKRRVFTALGNRTKLSSESLTELLVLAQELDSDYEKAEFLIELSGMCENDPVIQMQLLKAVSTLSSDYETNRVLSNTEFDCDSQSELVLAKLDLLTNMASDYEKVQALLSHAECASSNQDVRTHYLKTLGNIGSDYEKKRALLELIEESDINDQMVIDYLSACKSLVSDYDKGQVLKELSDYVRGNDDLEELYLDIVDQIQSDYERDQLYKQIDKRRKSSRSSLHFD